MSEKWTAAKEDIKELEQKVRTAETFTRNDSLVKANIKKSHEELTMIDQQFLADEANTFAWAAGQAYAVGREVGLELEVTDGKVVGREVGQVTKIAHFVPYSININTECSYDQLVVLLKKFEKLSPYTSIANLAVISSPQNNLKHSVTFKVQWPLFQDPTKREKIING
jgi:hypothetical protein